ncbi:MAG: hypothetical protein N4A72_21680 [Bacteroidales bacterium]|jgi:hypothetical protein|nr:hypothetical protein [Bacteroidales bacterium]
MNKIEFLSKIEDNINTILSTINALKTTEHFDVIERDIILESIRNLYSFCITTDVDNSNKIQSVHSVISQIEDAIDQELIDAVNKAEQQEFIETETSHNIDDIDQEMIKAVEMAEQLQNSTETEIEEQHTDEEYVNDNNEMSMPSFDNSIEESNETMTDNFDETTVDDTEEAVIEPANEHVVDLPEKPIIDNSFTPEIKKDKKPQSVTDQYQQTNTLNDIISNMNAKTDIQSIITKQPIEDLNKAFGVNDKFRFSKLLFNNNIQDFNNTIWEINLLNNLDEAIMYISEKYSWSADDETVQEFIIMLQRRFN